MTDCVFCQIVQGETPAKVLRRWPDAIAIEPLNPVTIGHTLVIPVAHVADFLSDHLVAATTMARASEFAWWRTGGSSGASWNLITSQGEAATQTVMHLHIHLVPRRLNDGLRLPWSAP